MKKDELYADPQQVVPDFIFDERVAQVFPDMINRSVPGYATIINMIGTLASRRVTRGSNCYDLGCSLGAASMAVRSSMPHQDYALIAVDNSLPMLQQAAKLLEQDQADSPIQLVCSDVRDVAIERASMIILNFTLQFIPAEDRADFLTQLYDGMQDKGLLVLSEKIALSNEASQNLFTEMHHSFKKAQGYSDLEISQKRSALENVLIPETLETHKQRLQMIGFTTVEVWFQCFNFVSLLAIK
ncbi:MAG: carboxy-S-adenosyl-L-methionine synthase CmoA [Candidatus Thiodiazotropha lotti]|uniref:Carboxy-S-adenosyl-L-methionine synthase n=1 Tax=Candidatus Thiodiazotropha lotti TaxID=2792787 RepID=A0A9E4MYL2_9GAMM|nr:carboxy-S-adenosyl-L-methionine synthase CmoA [Candidatus Thiodiazotropha lotti]ODB99380.1 tRNA (uridine-5-oxyacetic acid methyl ester)(34) synthase TrmP [Candidatus Thiodiazotropha endoloripes]MCG7920327.1 carboxy-S-adenosyl-L-methionine synthase CmoA [Candidatus Thiodiazotropha lotti]MCG7931063.1 carboxy-S-adenosyl-L-methionine synthase CmoA [Candidatus Thiodiazotropha lotti]MCG7938582.1 carboxy-S-adenosyl-L-methionine synthase CmoA [Candidatus Thiodiazotropha lotti]